MLTQNGADFLFFYGCTDSPIIQSLNLFIRILASKSEAELRPNDMIRYARPCPLWVILCRLQSLYAILWTVSMCVETLKISMEYDDTAENYPQWALCSAVSIRMKHWKCGKVVFCDINSVYNSRKNLLTWSIDDETIFDFFSSTSGCSRYAKPPRLTLI